MNTQTQNKADETQNPLGQSDEDFLNSAPPPVTKEEESEEDPAEEEEEDLEEQEEDLEEEEDSEEEETPEDEDSEEEDDSEDDDDEAGDPPAEESEDEEESDEEEDSDDKKKRQEEEEDAEEDEESKVTLTKSEYDELLALKSLVDKPIKANGKEIQLKNADEVRKLVQQGADYTRKLQALVPYRKTALMVENANIDHERLSLLIDVNKGEKGAINKLLKDLKIDSLDLDTESEADYTAKDHRVTDEEASFHETLDDITSTEEGRESLKIFHTWDKESQDFLYGKPDMMQVMHEQRQSGIFDIIDTEITRQKALGQIPKGTPYLQSYKAVGDKIAAEGGFNHLNAPESESDPEKTTKQPQGTEQPAPKRRKVLDTRKGAAKNKASKGDGADKARPSRRGKRKTSSEPLNPLAMSDEEFLKLDQQFGDRL